MLDGVQLRARRLAGVVLLGLLAAAPAHAITLPSGFSDAHVADIGSPTALAFTPDGRLLIATQGGDLRIYQGGSLIGTPALSLNVCSNSERGLLGVAVDPSFAGNHFIYVYYTLDLSGTGSCNTSDPQVVNRVSRFTLPDTNVVDPATEMTLLDHMNSWAGNHNGGDVQFGKDGYLYVSIGDGGCDYNGGGCGGTNDASRDEYKLEGKILRITSTGGVPASNPFQGAGTARCDTTGGTTPGQRCQETFAWGLRNPFRMAFDPNDSGTRFFINDVGQNAWEEIDLGQSGVDYGWNCREGAHVNNTTGPCSPTPPNMIDPIYEYGHSSCGAITGGAFVPSAVWPAPYDVSYMYADYNCGRIFRLASNGSGGYTSTDFATGLGGSSAVAMLFGPDGAGQALYYTTYAGGGEVRKISYSGPTNRPPTAVVSASPTIGPAPLDVAFDGSGSSDPDGNALTYVWDFGEGDPPTETSTPTIGHVYATPGTFTASLVVRDTLAAVSDPATVVIGPGNSPPEPTITSPADGTLFSVGQSLTLSGVATDLQDGTLPPSALSWTVLKHHKNHTHPYLGPVTGNDIPLTAPAPEDLDATDNSYLEIYLTATDALGLSRTVIRRLMPHKVDVTFDTTPAGLRLDANGTSLLGPQSVVSWEGYPLNVTAPDQVDAAGHGRTFVSWSDAGASAHTITTPSTPTTYTASFALATAIAIDDVVVTEGSGPVNAVFTVRLSDPSAQTVTASYATADGSATAGSDYTASSGGVTFAPGEVTVTLAVPVLADAVLESTESFRVTLGGVSPSAVVVGKARGDGWILDAGAGPRVRFGAASYSIGEGGTATVTVKRTGDTSTAVSVDYAATDGSATVGSDYVASSGTLSFAAGVVSRMFTVRTSADSLAEGDETILLRLSNPSGAALGDPPVALLTIKDNDVAGRLQFSAPSYAADESGPAATITVTRTGGTAGGVTVGYASADGTATEGLDYQTTFGTLSFGPGVVKQVFSVPLVDDGIVEGNETVSLSLSDPEGGATLGPLSAAVLTIQEGNPVVQFSAANYAAPEAAPRAVITVKRSGPSTAAVQVNYVTSDGTAHAGVNYQTASGTLTFGPGVTSRTFAVPILNDTAHEASLTVLLSLSGVTSGAALGPRDTAVLSLGDNDPAGTLRFSAAGYRVSEAATAATIRVTRLGGTASDVTVQYATADGTAVAGLDYATTSGTLTFGAGVTSRTFDVPILPRSGFIGDRSLGLSLPTAGGGASLGTPAAATLTILSNDPLVQFSAAPYRVSESGPQAVIMVRRSGPMSGTVMVDYTTADGTATAGQDYETASGTLTFDPGVATRTFTVPVDSDALVEGDETVNLTLGNPQGAALGENDTALLTLATASPKVQFSAASYAVAEAASRAVITVRRTPPTSAQVTVEYSTSDGTAAAGQDYETASATLTFGPGVATRTFAVTLDPDALDENAETVGLSLANPAAAILGTPKDAVLTIADDDVGGKIQLTVADYSVSEAGPTAIITVTRSGGRAGGVTVDYAAADGTGVAGTNYVPSAGTLVFGDGDTTKSFAVEVLDDGVASGNKSVRLSLASAKGGAALGPRTTATLWIVER